MKKFVALLLISLSFLAFSCIPGTVHGQNVDGWFVKSLKMNAVGTHANVPNVNRANAGIWGTDTTLYTIVSAKDQSAGWWSIACSSTRVGTGTQSYISLKGSLDGINYFNLPGDSTKLQTYGKASNTLPATPFYKWTITSLGTTVFQGAHWPYPYAGLYILKGNDSTTVSCYYHFERRYDGK